MLLFTNYLHKIDNPTIVTEKVIKSFRPILRPVKHFICDVKNCKGRNVNKIFEKKIDIKVKKRNDGFFHVGCVFVKSSDVSSYNFLSHSPK